jgi:GNAT superfamily N-acetyltransferase
VSGAPSPGALRVEPATGAHAALLDGLFATASSPCHCRFFHFDGDKNAWLEALFTRPEENRAWFADGLARGAEETRGVVALRSPQPGASEDGPVAVGWLKLVRKPFAPRIYGQRYFKGLACLAEGDPRTTAHLSCALVRPDARGQGVLGALVGGAIALGRELGLATLEAFPRVVSCKVSDDEMFTLPASTLLAHGFEHAGGDPAAPVLRLALRSSS